MAEIDIKVTDVLKRVSSGAPLPSSEPLTDFALPLETLEQLEELDNQLCEDKPKEEFVSAF